MQDPHLTMDPDFEALGFSANGALHGSELAEQAQVVVTTLQPRGPELQQLVRDMLKLLSASEANFKQVESQGWCSRIWNTLSGKNKKLQKRSEANLVTMQRLSLTVLKQLASGTEEVAHAVATNTSHIRFLNFENLRLKSYLRDLSQRAFARFQSLEKRVENVERATDLNAWANALFHEEDGSYAEVTSLSRITLMSLRFAESRETIGRSRNSTFSAQL